MHEWGWTPRSAPRLATDRMLVATAPPGAAAMSSLRLPPLPLSPEARVALAARIQGVG